MGRPTTADVLAGAADWAVHCGDTRDWVRSLPANSVHCWVTSPPYFGLRDYQHPDQIGLEKTPDEYVAELVGVARDMRRALHPSGVFWLNLGDSYSGGGIGGGPKGDGLTGRSSRDTQPGRRVVNPDGVKPKDLIGVPWMVAFALRADGWYLRQWCPWVKRSGMPESATDRPGTSCETVFLLAKRPDYFFDMEAVKRPGSGTADRPHLRRAMQLAESHGLTVAHVEAIRACGVTDAGKAAVTQTGAGRNDPAVQHLAAEAKKVLGGYYREFLLADARNLRSGDFWFDSVGMLMAGDAPVGFDVPPKGRKDAHFAVMPEALVRPMVAAGSSGKGVCPECNAPWERVVERTRVATRPGTDTKIRSSGQTGGAYSPPGQPPHSNARTSEEIGNRDPERHVTHTRTVGWKPTCGHADQTPVPAVVADPFVGSGTVLSVARQLGRVAVGCDLNPDYVGIARRRVGGLDAQL